jgi:glycine cleavage system aminomethyltransferase T
MTDLLLTPLHEEHLKLNAKMIPFDGFDMPVQYTGILEEHFGYPGGTFCSTQTGRDL